MQRLVLFLIFSTFGKKIIDWQDSDIVFFRELKGQGFKQDCYTKVEMKTPKNCILHESISADWFIDIEEMPKTPKIVFNSKIDIEMPSSLSNPHNFTIILHNSTEFTFPVHVRYNDCASNRSHKRIF